MITPDQLARITDELLLDPQLVTSIIQIESSGCPWAWNPEPQYVYLWDVEHDQPFRRLTVEERASEKPPADFPAPWGVDPDAEFWGQQTSWGLMQVMGAVAREYGFKGKFLSELCDPVVGVWHGCKKLAALRRRYAVLEDVIAAYNAGSPRKDIHGRYVNQPYVDKVLGRLKDGRNELEG